MVEQKGEGLVNGRIFDDMVIIQDQGKFLAESHYVVEHGCQDEVEGGWLRRLEQVEGILAELAVQHLNSANQIEPEARRIVVAFIEGNPRHTPLALRDPGAEHGGLAKA